MNRRLPQTLTDYLLLAINPALIMLLIGSLVFFLLEAFYRGQYDGRLRFIFAMYVMGTVGVARISIQEGRSYASLFAAPLAIAAAVAMNRFVEFTGNLGPLSLFINWGLLGLVWWSADRLTWDCTVIDESQDLSGTGLLQSLGWTGWFSRRRTHLSGVWIVYFSVAALPLFGLGQWFLPADNAASQSQAFRLLIVYLGSALTLLASTSLLNVRKYLRQRQVEMPATITFSWLLSGGTLILIILLGAALLPRPQSAGWFTELAMSSAKLAPSRFGWGREGATRSTNTQAATTGESGASSQNSGPQGTGPQGTGSQGSGPQGSGPQGSGPQGSGPQGSGPQGSGPQGSGPQGSGPQGSGPQGSGPQGSGPQGSGPQGSGPQGSGPQGSGPQGSGPQGSGPQGSGPQGTGPQGSGPQGSGPQGSGPQGSGPQGSGPQGSGPQGSGPQGSGPQGSGPQGSGPQGSGPQGSGPQGSGPQGSGPQGSGPQGSGSQGSGPSSLSLGNLIEMLSGLLQVLLWLVGLVVIGWLAWRHRARIAEAWRQLCAEWRAFWERWFGRGKSAAAAAAPSPVPSLPRFADFGDPFVTGLARTAGPAEVVRYTFQALEAWARDRGCPRADQQTPLEFAQVLANHHAEIAMEARGVAEWYGQLAYAHGQLPVQSLDTMRRLWERLRA